MDDKVINMSFKVENSVIPLQVKVADGKTPIAINGGVIALRYTGCSTEDIITEVDNVNRIISTRLSVGTKEKLDNAVNSVDQRLSLAYPRATRLSLDNTKLFTENEGKSENITLRQIKELNTKIVTVQNESEITAQFLKELSSGDYIYVKE
jgi:hypothetical protein